MNQDIHQSPYAHPELPSYKSVYKNIDHQAVHAGYDIIFNPGRKRYITGGIATQFYIPEAVRRGSDDVDVTEIRPLTWQQFQQVLLEDLSLVRPRDGLEDYNVVFVRKNHSFRVHICNWDGALGDHRFFFDIDFRAHKGGYYRRNLPVYEREYAHARRFDITDGPEVAVLDPVDIISRKLLRVNNYYNHELIERLPQPPTSMGAHLDQLWVNRYTYSFLSTLAYEESNRNLINKLPGEHTKVRLICDSYDLRALLSFGPIDQSYLELVFREMEARGHDRLELERLLGELAPEFVTGIPAPIAYTDAENRGVVITLEHDGTMLVEGEVRFKPSSRATARLSREYLEWISVNEKMRKSLNSR